MKVHKEWEEATLEAAAAALSGGGVLVVPTETVYGIMTRWDSDSGRERIYALKHRPQNKLLQMLAPSVEAAVRAGVKPSTDLDRLAERFWPGPLTVVVEGSTPGETIGLRIPDHPFLLKMLETAGCVAAATSANLSGTPPAVNVEDALAGLDGEPDFAVDGGVITVTGGKASTVVSIVGGKDALKVIREGVVTADDIRKVLE